METTDERAADLAFDAATAYMVVIQELIVELVEGGALSRKAAANVLVRAESITRPLPEHDLRRAAVEALSEQIQQRLALRPDVAARRVDDPKEQAKKFPRRPRRPNDPGNPEGR